MICSIEKTIAGLHRWATSRRDSTFSNEFNEELFAGRASWRRRLASGPSGHSVTPPACEKDPATPTPADNQFLNEGDNTPLDAERASTVTVLPAGRRPTFTREFSELPNACHVDLAMYRRFDFH